MRLFLFVVCAILSPAVFSQSFYLFIGTYTDTGSKGIYVYRFNSVTGKCEWLSNTDSLVNPSFLTISPDKKFVYSVTESASQNPGNVSAFTFDRNTNKLKLINKQTSGGANPCYISASRNNDWVIVGNYTDGSLSALKRNKDGSLNAPSQVVQHSGKSIHKNQDKPHVHCTVLSHDEKYLLVPDLGIDKVMIYKFKGGSKKPIDNDEPEFVSSDPGSGPRHITFHPNKKFAYLVEELSGTVTAYRYNKGRLHFIQVIATHQAGYKGPFAAADIHVSPDGKFLYASNRAEENNIAVFSVDQTTGMLTSVGFEPTTGKTPRNFMIDPTGRYLLVANQNSGNVVIFKRDAVTGLLTKTGEEIKVLKPVCLKMME